MKGILYKEYCFNVDCLCYKKCTKLFGLFKPSIFKIDEKEHKLLLIMRYGVIDFYFGKRL
jgi:hypothetical protein